MRLKNPHSGIVSLSDMLPGQVGLTPDGRLYYRTKESATCLTEPGKSYTGNVHLVKDVLVTLYQPGTELTLIVDV